MQKQTKKYILILTAFLTMPSFAFAAPALSGISGTVQNGQSVTISGSGFGTKASATPMVWDNFDSQQLGSVGGKSPILGPTWGEFYVTTDGDPREISDVDSHSGDKSVYIKWDITTQNAIVSNFGSTDRVYVSWWAYQHWDDAHTYEQKNQDIADSCNRKWFYIFSGNTGSNLPQAMPLIPAGNIHWGIYDNNYNYPTENYESANAFPSNDNVTYADTDGVWQRWEYWLKLDSVGNAYDGVAKWWLSGKQQTDINNYGWRDAGDSDVWDRLYLGNMWQGMTVSSSRPYVFIDDVYVDFSQARVEIGNASTFAACTHREIQIPSAWNDTGITFTANQGSFSNGQAYLFVIDENGNPNATGYPITLSTTPDTVPPANPSGLSVS